jgi:rod shape-determining protein MreD
MHWLSFGIFTAVLVTLQAAVGPTLQISTIRADWLLVCVVFYALYAPKPEAILAAWITGAAGDLFTLAPFGFLAISYAIVAVGVTIVREYVFRYRRSTQFALTLMVAIFIQFSWLVYQRILHGGDGSAITEFFVRSLPTAAYTALWAPILHRLFLSLSGILGISHPRYTYGGLRPLETRRV